MMPLRDEMRAAQATLEDAGWEHIATMMVDDAHAPGVENFGMLFVREGVRFWLNYKTYDRIPQ